MPSGAYFFALPHPVLCPCRRCAAPAVPGYPGRAAPAYPCRLRQSCLGTVPHTPAPGLPPCPPLQKPDLPCRGFFCKKRLTTPPGYGIILKQSGGRHNRWGFSSAGRALAWHARGHRFDPGNLHQEKHHTEMCGAFAFTDGTTDGGLAPLGERVHGLQAERDIRILVLHG